MAAKADFRELLQETKLITDKTYKKVQENSACLTEIEDILKKDRRFLVLDAAAAERTRLLMGYLEELARRGPPPPPTASEPSRRPTTKYVYIYIYFHTEHFLPMINLLFIFLLLQLIYLQNFQLNTKSPTLYIAESFDFK